MHFTHSLTPLLVNTILLFSQAYAQAQNQTLEACLDAAGVRNIVAADPTWATESTPWQLRLRTSVNPSAIAYPADRPQLAASIACGRAAGVKISPYGGGHSFAAYGLGDHGSLVVKMEAFQDMSYDATTELFTFGGGVRVGPGVEYLWENHGRHFPHVRHGRVGLVGSSIGGAHGSTSRFLGAPGANIVGVEYMLWNGTIVTGGEGSELLWAAQGAGASFGAILSMTTKTWKPIYQTAVNFTLALNTRDLESGVQGLMAVQDFATTEAPDTLALRWALTAAPQNPWSATGYFYGDPATFEAVMQPLMSRLPNATVLTKSEFEFYDMEILIAPGTNVTDGGASPGRAFYIQALTFTTDNPFTEESLRILLSSTTFAFNRTDIRKSGFIDLWGGVSRDVSDEDHSFAHGKNLWLIRWEANAANAALPYPDTAVAYLRDQMRPFEDYYTSRGVALRGFATYRDTELTEEQWSQRLYGPANYERLLALKRVVDPEALFTSNKQDIPVKA